MKVEFKVSDLATVTGEGANHKEVMKDLAGLAEVFSVDKCGKCGKKELIPVVRTQGKFTYYEMKCKSCNAKLSYGQATGGSESLYPRRKYHDKHPLVKSGEAKEGDYLPNGGWDLWEYDPDAEEGQSPKKLKK